MDVHSGNQGFAGLSCLEELVLCQLDDFGYGTNENTYLPLPSDTTLSRLTKLTRLMLHVSISQASWQKFDTLKLHVLPRLYQLAAVLKMSRNMRLPKTAM